MLTVACLAWLAGCVVPALGTTADRPGLARAPGDVRAFLLAAKKAEAIRDPLSRCLAYPDYPGNAWPKGLVEAYCHYMHDPAITLATVRKALDHHALPGLEARFRADLERHFAKRGFSEVIHRDLRAFDGSQEAGALSKRWLAQAPHSPFAWAARGQYLLERAVDVRGTAWAQDTPSARMERMSAFDVRALQHFRRALKIEPRLIQAYVGEMRIAMLEGDDALGQRAFEKASAIDPACKVLATARMMALEPRWGGSYQAMNAYAAQLRPLVHRRPLLTLSLEAPRGDLADVVSWKLGYKQALSVLKPLLPLTAGANLYDHAALWSRHVEPHKGWEQLMLLVEASRFSQGSEEAARLRGRLLLNLANQPEWAQASLKAATRMVPGDAYAHYLLAASYWSAGDPARSEHDYLLAMSDASLRRDALQELIRAMLQAKETGKARKYVNLFNRVYSNDVAGWGLRIDVLLHQRASRQELTDALNTFISKAKQSNSVPASRIRLAERLLRKINSSPAATGKAQ